MEIIHNTMPKVYLIHKTDTDSFKLCKILNQYDSIDEVNEDLAKLLTKKITEKELLKEFGRKELF